MNKIVRKEAQELTTPGIGIAGEVICPIMSIGRIGGAPCVKHMCEFWVELTYAAGTKDERRVARCALAWLPTLSTELTGTIKNTLKPEVKK